MFMIEHNLFIVHVADVGDYIKLSADEHVKNGDELSFLLVWEEKSENPDMIYLIVALKDYCIRLEDKMGLSWI